MEKRMAGDYEIIHAFHIGDREIVLGESLNCNPGERYMCAYCQQNEITARRQWADWSGKDGLRHSPNSGLWLPDILAYPD